MNILKKLVILLLVLFLNGCSQEFLEPISLSTFDTNYLFSNVDDARRATNAIYQQFSTDGYTTRLSTQMQGNTDIETHGASTINIQDVQSKPNIEIEMLKPQESNLDLDKAWTSGYSAIRDCNIVIDGIRASGALESTNTATKANMYQFLGEAYTIRAYWYSMLIYSFGDVPFSTQAPKAGIDFNLPREDRNLILTALIKDLKEIEPNMKWSDELPFGVEQVNREFTMGMIARLSLQRGGYFLKPDMTMERPADYKEYYTIAKEYSKKLMDLKDRVLPTDFAQIFKNESQFIVAKNSDVLFEIPFAIGEGDVGYNIGIYFNGGTHPYGRGGAGQWLPASYYYSFDSKDLRRNITCGLYNYDTNYQVQVNGINAISQGKWSRGDINPAPGATTSKGTGINFPLMRYSDVILMNAEAENELNGPTAVAQAALKRVRQRAFDPLEWSTKVNQYVTNVSSSKDAFLDAIINERAWEFGGEFLRKSDLIRWGNYKAIISKTVTTLKALADESADINGIRPNFIYWKRTADNKFVTFNTDTREIPADLANWTRNDWLKSLKSSIGIDGYSNFITVNWFYYLDTAKPVRYINPIPSRAIIASQGVLKNDGYGYGN